MPEPMIPEPTIPTRLMVMARRLPGGSFRRPGAAGVRGGRGAGPSRLPTWAAHARPPHLRRRLRPDDRARRGGRSGRAPPQPPGRGLEVGGGTGHNLAYFSAAREVVVLEPDGAMRRHLEGRLDTCPVPARVV